MGSLILVSTPIGNLKDISLRALEALYSCDLIVCEDTREASKLLDTYKDTYGSYPRLLSYNDHNREQRMPEILNELIQGKTVCFTTDRGTPLLSDPGYKLVQEVYQLQVGYPDITIDSIPGASALLPALQLSGFPPDRFFFAGFLPRKKSAQKELFDSLPTTTIVAYESPHRLIETLSDLLEEYGDMEVAVCLELTKMFQEVRRGVLSNVIDHYSQKPPKGEVTIVFRHASPLE